MDTVWTRLLRLDVLQFVDLEALFLVCLREENDAAQGTALMNSTPPSECDVHLSDLFEVAVRTCDGRSVMQFLEDLGTARMLVDEAISTRCMPVLRRACELWRAYENSSRRLEREEFSPPRRERLGGDRPPVKQSMMSQPAIFHTYEYLL